MFRCRSWALRLSWVPIALVVVVGCQDTPRRLDPLPVQDDFGEELGPAETFDEETVSDTHMLHRRVQLELTQGVVMPSGHMDWGPRTAFKGSIETMKNLYWGIAFDWANQKITKSITQEYGSIVDLSRADPDQYFRDFDRYSFLGVLDYDLPVTKNFLGEDLPLFFRVGVGMGVQVVNGDEDPVVRAAGYKVVPFVGFIFRPAASFRWQVWKHGLITLGTGFDLVAPDTIDVKVSQDRRQVDGRIDFSTFFIGAGIALEF